MLIYGENTGCSKGCSGGIKRDRKGVILAPKVKLLMT